ncbi:MAG: EAL domain-containing protein [Sulfurimonas sp.]|jgi:diguanylate cyclase (GGDEF)-like protein/PAS domain S-box-containing protein
MKIDKIKKTVIAYAFSTLIVWSIINVFFAWWNVELEKKSTINDVTSIVRSNFDKDMAYRKWASGHGGVYVEPTEKTPPSPWMAHLEERDIVTTKGKKLTLMNPAYMLREMMQDYSDLYGLQGRIVGIVYLNKNNKANEWEANAIRSFDKGTQEIMEFTGSGDNEYLRLMKPMFMEQDCQKCHGHLGFANGSVRGGVSISLPMKTYRESESKFINSIILTYFIVWFIGTLAIIIVSINAFRYLKRRDSDLEELVISSQVFNNTLDGIFITDATGKILRINSTFIDMTGFSEEEAIGRNPKILKSERHTEEFYKNLWGAILKEGHAQYEIWNRRKDGDIFVAIESITTIKDENDAVKYFIATLHDITAKKNAEERVVHMAHYDPLTDLPNRVLFQDRFLHAIEIAKRQKQNVAIAFIDIDGFKKVNDTKGHPLGDKLLIELGKKIVSCVRKYDTVSRLGGDEFTVIFESLSQIDSIVPICENILKVLREEIIIDNQSIFVSASIGISVYPNDGKDIHSLIQHADTAMYKAKENGKNRFNFYEESMTQQAKEKVSLETSIHTALKNEEFKVYYQPKIVASNREIIGMEALVRWLSPEKGLIPPYKFIPVAEDIHIVDKIDMFVLEQVCKDMTTWKELGFHDLKVAVNLSGYDIGTRNLFQNIIDIVETYKIEPRNLEFEITETYFVNFAPQQMKTLEDLKMYGFSLSIDDFGTGYSSLSSLKKLPVDILKIDQSFIATLEDNEESKELVDMIIKLAHIFSLKTIAEGVETEYQHEYLKSKGCDFIQGYLESRPIPKEEFVIYLSGK